MTLKFFLSILNKYSFNYGSFIQTLNVNKNNFLINVNNFYGFCLLFCLWDLLKKRRPIKFSFKERINKN